MFDEFKSWRRRRRGSGYMTKDQFVCSFALEKKKRERPGEEKEMR
jgi:hypothetical protein